VQEVLVPKTRRSKQEKKQTLRIFQVRTDPAAVRAIAELDQELRQKVERRQRARDRKTGCGAISDGFNIEEDFIMD